LHWGVVEGDISVKRNECAAHLRLHLHDAHLVALVVARVHGVHKPQCGLAAHLVMGAANAAKLKLACVG
jgi:hypothetical protein